MKFSLTEDEQVKLDEWLVEIKKEAAEKNPDPVMKGEPYYGAIGGGLTYCFTPTGLGVITVVKETITGKEINLTDFDSW